jgi:leucyl aminopeptidase
MKTKGQKFLEKFINNRERDPTALTRHIEADLLNLDIDSISRPAIFSETFRLLAQFFNTVQILHINPDVKSDTVLIGKGITYDTGGYNLKTNMRDMHYDKNGALLAIAAAIDNNVPALVFFAQNDLNNRVVQGDILTESITGKRILIENTDAEGRIGLANLLAYAQDKYKNAITIATLTGAACQMVGERTYAVIHSNDVDDYQHFALHNTVNKAEFWPAPYHKDYDNAIKTKVKGADITNCPDYKGAGSSTAFSFLKQFYNGHLIHLDIAPVMVDKDHNGLVWGLNEVKLLIDYLK